MCIRDSLYPTPHTVSMGSAPATFSFARAFATCTDIVDAALSASHPNTFSTIWSRENT